MQDFICQKIILIKHIFNHFPFFLFFLLPFSLDSCFWSVCSLLQPCWIFLSENPSFKLRLRGRWNKPYSLLALEPSRLLLFVFKRTHLLFSSKWKGWGSGVCLYISPSWNVHSTCVQKLSRWETQLRDRSSHCVNIQVPSTAKSEKQVTRAHEERTGEIDSGFKSQDCTYAYRTI